MTKGNWGALTRRDIIRVGGTGLLAAALPSGAFAQDKKLKVAAIFATPIEEPWDHQIHVALQQAESEGGIEYKWSEKVQTADFGRVMREYATGGYELVLGDAFAAERESRRTAKEFPKDRSGKSDEEALVRKAYLSQDRRPHFC